jgi:hypothetical protein
MIAGFERGQNMKKERRWLQAALAASAQPLPALPWQRQTRRRPDGLKTTATPPRIASIAAR